MRDRAADHETGRVCSVWPTDRAPSTLLSDLNAFGLQFESLVVRDLRVYAQPPDGEVFHYRDQSGLEVDAIVDTGEQGLAFEVKLGVGPVDQAAGQLAPVRRTSGQRKRGETTVFGVIVGTGYGYVRHDGIHVITVGALGLDGVIPARGTAPTPMSRSGETARPGRRSERHCPGRDTRPSTTNAHDDLHAANLYADGDRLRVLDWGDASIAHPLPRAVGPGHEDEFALALRVGTAAHTVAWLRHRNAMPAADGARFDTDFAVVLRRAVLAT